MFFLYAASPSTASTTCWVQLFLSKNVTYFFFESMITLLYQPLCCGSPMGTMNFSMCNGIWLTEFSQSFFLPINSFPLSLYKRSLESKHENAFCSACTTSSHVLDLNRMSQGYYFADGCYGRWCEKYPIMTWGANTRQISKVS